MRVKSTQATTPPLSSDEGNGKDGRTKRGRSRLAYNRTKAYRQIVSLKSSLQSEKTAKEKYKRRWLRIKTSLTSSRASTLTSDSCHNDVRTSCTSPDTEIESAEFDLDNSSISTSKQDTSQHGNKLDVETRCLVEDFLTRDDNSRLTTGKKQTVTKNKVKEQKRLLQDAMTNLHEKFCAEYPSNDISYVTFTRYRPFWVRQPTAKDRETCLCRKHENVQLAVDKLYQLGALKVNHSEELLEEICCSVERKQCMFRECESCVNRCIKFIDKCLLKDDSMIVWSEWETVSQTYTKDGEEKTTKVTKKSIKRGKLKELKSKFVSQIC